MSFVSNLLGSSNNYNVTNGLPAGTQATIKNYDQPINAGIDAFKNSTAGLDSLAMALQQQMNGQGPNLANALLQQSTGQNVANQAALMAGQRGASQNAGLIARQAGQIGSQAQQQEAGQASVNRMQQQLQAQSQLGNVLGTQGQLGNQMFTSGANALNTQNGMITNTNTDASKANGTIAGSNATMNGNIAGGVLNAAGKIFGMANGGSVTDHPSGLHFAPHDYRVGGPVQAANPQQKAVVSGNSPKNDKIPAVLSEGEVVIDRETLADNGPLGKAARLIAKHIEARNAKK